MIVSFTRISTFAYVFMPISRWAITPVFQLLDIRREPGLSPFGYPFVSLEDSSDVPSNYG
jgi:hypothetical protein